jgi:hypothetical protein
MKMCLKFQFTDFESLNSFVGLNVNQDVYDAKKKMYKGTEFQWISLKLEGKDLNQVCLVQKGGLFFVCVNSWIWENDFFKKYFHFPPHHIANGDEYQSFLDTAFPSDETRYNILRYEYDLGLDGKRVKTILFSWCPHGVKVKEKMIFASSKVGFVSFSVFHSKKMILWLILILKF